MSLRGEMGWLVSRTAQHRTKLRRYMLSSGGIELGTKVVELPSVESGVGLNGRGLWDPWPRAELP